MTCSNDEASAAEERRAGAASSLSRARDLESMREGMLIVVTFGASLVMKRRRVGGKAVSPA